MSIRVMSQVWDHASVEGGELLVLLALADFANDDGWCWPSMAQIAAKARMTERGARGIVRRLEGAGLVQCERARGRTYSNRYCVTVKPEHETRNDVPISPEKPEYGSTKPERDCIKTGTAVPPNLKEPSKEPSKNISASPRGVLTSILSEETAKAVVEHRQRIRKPLTAEAARRLAKELAKCPDAEAAANEMLLRGWQGVKAEWLTNGSKQGSKADDRFARIMSHFSDGVAGSTEAEPSMDSGPGEGATRPLLPHRSVGS